MKKFLFLTLLLVALSYPAITLLAQEAATDILEDMLIKNNEEVATQESEPNAPIVEKNVVVETVTDDKTMTQPPVNVQTKNNKESIVEEVVTNDSVSETNVILPVKPRNPDTQVIIKQPEEDLETPTPTQNNTPLDAPISDIAVGQTMMGNVTHPQLNLSEDKSEMIRLSEKAASVIVGNPNHISVLLDTPDTIIVVPRLAGASHFTVIGENGKIIMQRHVIVGAPKDNYIRIRRSCNGDDPNCQQTSVYYCPNTCHQIIENTDQRR